MEDNQNEIGNQGCIVGIDLGSPGGYWRVEPVPADPLLHVADAAWQWHTAVFIVVGIVFHLLAFCGVR